MTEDTAWPEAWSALYDAMDVDRRLHVDFYAGLVTPGTRSLLDLGCGTGSITLAMAKAMAEGGRVVGVDLSPKMIEIARARAPQHDWQVGDLCQPGVQGPFDLIVICFHTLQMLVRDDQVRAAFRSVAGLLSPEGRFAFDIYQPNLPWLAQVSPEESIARAFTLPDGTAIDVVERGARYDPQSLILTGEWILRERDSGRVLPVEPIIQRARQYFPTDILAMLDAADLAVEERFGELDRRPLTSDSKRQVYVCRRKASATAGAR